MCPEGFDHPVLGHLTSKYVYSAPESAHNMRRWTLMVNLTGSSQYQGQES